MRFVFVFVLVFGATTVHAQPREPTRLLRQVTLDLADRPPTDAEYQAALAGGPIDDAIDRLLTSREHLDVLREYHRALLQDTLAQLPQLAAVANVLAPARPRMASDAPWFGRAAARFRRGAVQLSCADVRHDRFAADGSAIPLADAWTQGASVTNAAGETSSTIFFGGGASRAHASPCRMDGWVEVAPYWDPSATIRVCAFDAQTTASGIGLGGRPLSCDPRDPANPNGAAPSPSCGCGEHLAYCVPATQTPAGQILRASIEDEPLHVFEDVIAQHHDYFDALTTRDTFVNGALATYLRATGGGVVFDVGAEIPALPYGADWTRVTRGPAHAGVLTTMAYLARFTSQRGRAQRFRQAFRCEEFASIALPPTEAQPPLDLAQRAGCNGCHAALEPLTQHFARFRINLDYGLIDDGSGTYQTLSRSGTNPFADRCGVCGRRGGPCPPYCDLYYFTQHTTPDYDRAHVGELQTTAFDWGEPGLEDDRARFDGGPAALVAAGLVRDGDAPSVMEACAIRTRAESLLHRPLTDDERTRWMPQLLAAFTGSGEHDFLALERAIVRDSRYRGN